ncbi:MAG: hypothetical protein RIT27_134 [Pseudomonadota bacterium]|jgi:nitric oxide reductase subunit C
MSEVFTKTMARNIYYGGSVFFLLLFFSLTFHTTQGLSKRDHRENITDKVVRGKGLWETNNCIGCHTLLGEGAYFAPELGNVFKRYGSKEAIIGFIKSRPPMGIPGRRSMPQFNFTDQQLDDLAEFLKWTSEVNTSNWPPNIQG